MTTKEKIDLFKLHKNGDYATPKKPMLVDIKRATYLTIEGKGAPGGEEFAAKIGALYGVAYTIKMTRKFDGRQDYVIGKLEAQWWVEGGQSDLAKVPKDRWQWRMMIRTPDFVGQDELKQAVSALLDKGKDPEVRDVKLEPLAAGQCVQMLHVGPYEKEGETIAKMTAFAEKEGLETHGRHHEVYLSDPRRVPPERLKTILRLPARQK
ncbi:MAG: GyrI-like domain-containing protein [Candidatus Krumholzibacteriia bacterium]